MTLPPAEEHALVVRARSGERWAFEVLVREHADCLYAVLLRFCTDEEHAREVTCATFIRAWQMLGEGLPGRRFFAVLCQFGLDEARRATRTAAGGCAPAYSLEQAIRCLPPDERIAVVLHDVEGWSTRRAAELLGVRTAVFARRVSRARMRLHRDLDAPVRADQDAGAAA